MIKIRIDMTKKSRIIIGSLLMLTTLSFAEYTPKKNKSFADDKYVLVFSDELNLPNGSQPDSTKWSRCSVMIVCGIVGLVLPETWFL